MGYVITPTGGDTTLNPSLDQGGGKKALALGSLDPSCLALRFDIEQLKLGAFQRPDGASVSSELT